MEEVNACSRQGSSSRLSGHQAKTSSLMLLISFGIRCLCRMPAFILLSHICSEVFMTQCQPDIGRFCHLYQVLVHLGLLTKESGFKIAEMPSVAARWVSWSSGVISLPRFTCLVTTSGSLLPWPSSKSEYIKVHI